MDITGTYRTLSFKEAFGSVLSGQSDPNAIAILVGESHRIARAYLLQKTKRGSLHPDFFGLTLDDLALDCLADLFQRDEAGIFVQLDAHFTTLGWQALDEEDLHIALRRMVFNKVNEGLFRRYREADPGLAKLIRNLKLAVKSATELSLARRGTELWLIVGAAGELSSSLPMAPPEILEAYLITSTEGTRPLSEMLAAFASFTKQETSYCNGYPLTSFAQIVRTLFITLESASPDGHEDKAFLPSNVERAIQLGTDQVQEAKYETYVEKKKVDEETYQTYFRTVRDILVAQYMRNELPEVSYFEALKRHIPSLTEEDYRGNHRHIMEYVTKLSRASVIRYLSDDA